MFRVIKAFSDLQNRSYIYRVGDVYPVAGYTPTQERIEELLGDKNALNQPLIVEEKEEVEVELKEEPKPVVDEPKEEKPKAKKKKKE